MSLLDEIRRRTKVEFRAATEAGLETLRSLGFPEDALAFYKNSEPAMTAEIGKARLLPIAGIVEENRDYVPGVFAFPSGYAVFATTICGDAFCIDKQSTSDKGASIVLIAHDLEPADDEMKREDLAKLAKPIASSFQEFLERYASEALDTKPLYPKAPFDAE